MTIELNGRCLSVSRDRAPITIIVLTVILPVPKLVVSPSLHGQLELNVKVSPHLAGLPLDQGVRVAKKWLLIVSTIGDEASDRVF